MCVWQSRARCVAEKSSVREPRLRDEQCLGLTRVRNNNNNNNECRYKPLYLEDGTVAKSLSNLRQRSFPDYDLVVIVTMHPSGVGAGIAGYAMPLQHYAGTDTVDDPATRVVVAQYNWCPNQINTDNANSKSELSKAARLIMHETLHNMNAVKTSRRYFSNAWGGQRCEKQIFIDSVEEWSGIRTRKVVANRTVTVAREQFGCDSLEGVPIENQYIGYGSHWESRVTGPEVLACVCACVHACVLACLRACVRACDLLGC